MERGPRAWGNPRAGEASFGARYLEGPSSLTDIAVARARVELERVNGGRFDLQRFAPTDNVRSAGIVLRGVPGFLSAHSDLPQELEDVRERLGQGRTTMLVIPDMPLVLASTGSTITALAPVLSCTRLAITEAFAGKQRTPGGHEVLFSDGGLDDVAWESFGHGRLLSFDSETMDPADYIGLAVKTFPNETFRMRFRKGDTTFSPLIED